MWDQSSGSQFGQIIQSLMQQNPQVAQRLMQLMSQQRTAGIGSLMPRQGGGPMPMGQNLAMQVPPGGMPRTNGPSSYGGQPPQGGVRPGLGGSTLDTYPQMGGNNSQQSAQPWDVLRQRMMGAQPLPTGGFAAANAGFQGTGPTMPYGQRFNTSPQPYTPPAAMPTADRPAAPYRAPAYTPAPFSAPAAQPKTYGAPTPAGPSLAQNGTAGLDWYAMQAGN